MTRAEPPGHDTSLARCPHRGLVIGRPDDPRCALDAGHDGPHAWARWLKIAFEWIADGEWDDVDPDSRDYNGPSVRAFVRDLA